MSLNQASTPLPRLHTAVSHANATWGGGGGAKTLTHQIPGFQDLSLRPGTWTVARGELRVPPPPTRYSRKVKPGGS